MHLSRNILVVDDDPVILMVMEEIFKKSIKVDTCSNAIDALHLMTFCKYPLVITDINMPYVSGVEFIEFINNFEFDTKFIIVSNHIKEYKNVEIKNVVGKFGKPFDVKDLFVMVQDYLGEKKYENNSAC